MKPAVLIVPGAWQKAEAFALLEAALAAAGFPAARTVSLPTVGAVDCAAVSFADDVAAVLAGHAALLAAGHARVLVYCHSYGGVVGSNAVGRLRDDSAAASVAGIVYASAFVLPKGRSLFDMLGGQPLPWMVVESDRVLGGADTVQIAFNDLPAEQVPAALDQMTWTAMAAFVTPSAHTPWLAEDAKPAVTADYIFATLDGALPLSYQQAMAASLPATTRTAAEPSGHCPHLSRPARIAAILAGWY